MKENLPAATQFRMQEIHTPSAFEGALWAAVGIKDARTIFHAPPGCYINQHVNILVNDWTTELYSTNLSYANVDAVATKHTLRNRVAAAIGMAAWQVFEEATPTQARLDWAKQAISSCESMAAQWMWAVCGNATVQTANFNPTDGDIEYIVNAMRDDYSS